MVATLKSLLRKKLAPLTATARARKRLAICIIPTTVPAENASGVVLRTRRATKTEALPVSVCLMRMETAETPATNPGEQEATMARSGVMI